MTDLVAAEGAYLAELSAKSNAELRQELADQLSLTAKGLMRAAAIWSELTRRGIDMSSLRAGLAIYLPRIARGELAAEAVIAFAGQRMLLQHMAGMDLDEQRRLAAGEPITLAERDDEGRVLGVQRRLAEMTSREVLLALSDGRVRTLKEQTGSLIRSIAKPARRRSATGSTTTIKAVDGQLQIGRSRIEPADLAGALGRLGFKIVPK